MMAVNAKPRARQVITSYVPTRNGPATTRITRPTCLRLVPTSGAAAASTGSAHIRILSRRVPQFLSSTILSCETTTLATFLVPLIESVKFNKSS